MLFVSIFKLNHEKQRSFYRFEIFTFTQKPIPSPKLKQHNFYKQKQKLGSAF